MIIEKDLTEEEKKKEEQNKYSFFNTIVNFAKPYLQKICSKEFYEFFKVEEMCNYDDTQKFYADYELNPEIERLYFHLLYFDLVITIFSFNDFEGYESLSEARFFEEKEEKIWALNL